MSQTLKCKELNCKETIDYTPDRVIAFIKRTTSKKRPKNKKVYLTCSKGHTHPYTVKVQD